MGSESRWEGKRRCWMLHTYKHFFDSVSPVYLLRSSVRSRLMSPHPTKLCMKTKLQAGNGGKYVWWAGGRQRSCPGCRCEVDITNSIARCMALVLVVEGTCGEPRGALQMCPRARKTFLTTQASRMCL